MFSKVIEGWIRSSDEERYLSNNKLQSVAGFFEKSRSGVEAASQLVEKTGILSENAAEAVIQKLSNGVKATESIPALTLDKKEKLVNDVYKIIRIITYCLVASSTSLLDEYFIKDVKEGPTIFDLPPTWYIEALIYIKFNHDLVNVNTSEVNIYIDHGINALS